MFHLHHCFRSVSNLTVEYFYFSYFVDGLLRPVMDSLVNVSQPSIETSKTFQITRERVQFSLINGFIMSVSGPDCY